MTDEEYDKNDTKNVADSDDIHILIKWGSLESAIGGEKVQ